MAGDIDLHMHSNRSTDGEKSPEELVALSAGAGMRWIAVADHNRVDGVGAAQRAGAAAGVKVIPCVELDCAFGGLELHVLGYWIDPADPRYAAVWEDVAAKQARASAKSMELVRKLGIAFDEAAVMALSMDGIVTGEALAEAALDDPRNTDNAVLAPYRPGGARSDNPYVNFYWDFCARGKPAHVAIAYMTLAEGISLIRRTGGVPVLAHPGQTLRDAPGMFPDIVRAGIRGVEAYSSYHSEPERRRWAGEAEKHGLLVTCGSDYHGKTKPAIAIGGHGCDADGDEMAAALRAAARSMEPR